MKKMALLASLTFVSAAFGYEAKITKGGLPAKVEAMLEKADIIEVDDEICGHEYRFGPEILNELFPPEGRVLH